MATSAGEGASSYQGGGAGGKFRKQPFRKPQSTPYDRPPTALRNPSWVSKMIMDPASKVFAAGAHHLFSSLFRKRLTHTPPPPPGAHQESRDTYQETVMLSPAGDERPVLDFSGKQSIPEDQGLKIKDNEKQMATTDSDGLSELELMLKQKTFTRSEIDRLTEVLHSRTVESSNGVGERIVNFRCQETVSTFLGQDNFVRNSLQKTGNESHLENHRLNGHVPTSAVTSEVFEEDVATPAEIAKAYMGHRSSKVSPSVLGLRSQANREDFNAMCNTPFAPRSPVTSLVHKPCKQSGVLENGFMTPKSRERSAIYSTARTPYSRNLPTASHKGHSSIYDGYGGQSGSPSPGFARELASRSVSKDLALKRRSSVLDDEIGSVGPIRRLRQKINLSTPKNKSLAITRTPFSRRGTGISTNGTQDLSPSSRTFQGSKENGNIPSTSYTPVPSQSKETARKILQQLEKLAPKEKKIEENEQLMPNMLQGRALKSSEDLDSSKTLQGAGYNFNFKQKGILPDAGETSFSQTQDKVEENGRRSPNVFNGSLAPGVTSNGTVVIKDTVPPFSFLDSVKKQGGTQSSQKKWGFQITAQEGGLELDNEIPSNEATASTKQAGEKRILEKIMADSKAVPVTEEKATSVSELKAPVVSSEFEKPTDLGNHDGTNEVEKSGGFIFSDAPAVSTSFPTVVSVSQSTTFTKNVSDKEPNAPPPLFNFGTNNDDKKMPITFPSSPLFSGSLGVESTASTEAKQETNDSLAINNITSDASETVPKPAEPVKSGTENPESLLPTSSSVFTVGSMPTFSSPSNSTSSQFIPIVNNTGNNQTLLSNNPFTGFSFSSTTSSNSENNQKIPPPNNLFTGSSFPFSTTNSSTTTSITPSTTPLSLPTIPDFKSGSFFTAPPSTTSSSGTTSGISISTAFTFGAQPPPPGLGSSSAAAMSSPSPFSFSAQKTQLPVDTGNNNNNNNNNGIVEEDTSMMAEDSVVQPVGPTPPSFPVVSSPFMFSASTFSSPGVNNNMNNNNNNNPFQQYSNPFQQSSLGGQDLGGNGSFSLGSGGGEGKSGRRFVKVKRTRNGKK